jgi:hypothetical protein
MRRTEDGKWCHATCAFWHPEIKYLHQVVFNPARSFEHVRAERKILKYAPTFPHL